MTAEGADPGGGPIARPCAVETVAPTDEDLLRRHVAGGAGGEDAFRELLARHQGWVHGYLLARTGCPETARDLAQEVFLRVARGASRFRFRSRFSTWLFAITENVRRKHRLKQGRARWVGRAEGVAGRVAARLRGRPSAVRHESGPDDPDGTRLAAVADPRPGPDRHFAGHERLGIVRRTLAAMPERQQRALLLVNVEGLSIREAARALDVAEGTVKTSIFRGRLRLARALAEGGPP